MTKHQLNHRTYITAVKPSEKSSYMDFYSCVAIRNYLEHESDTEIYSKDNILLYRIEYRINLLPSLSLKNCMIETLINLSVKHNVDVQELWEAIQPYIRVYTSIGIPMSYIVIRNRDISDTLTMYPFLDDMCFNSITGITHCDLKGGLSLKELLSSVHWNEPIGMNPPGNTPAPKQQKPRKIRKPSTKGLGTIAINKMDNMGYRFGDSAPRQADRFYNQGDKGRFDNMIKQFDSDYGTRRVNARLEKLTVDKVVSTLQKYYRDKHHSELPFTIAELLIIEDDWSFGNLWDKAKQYGGQAVDFLSKNYPKLIEAGKEALQGNYLNAAKSVVGTLLNDSPTTAPPPGAIHGTFGPAYTYISNPGSHHAKFVSVNDVSIRYIAAQLDHQQPSSGPPTLPPLQCATNALLVSKFTVNISASTNGFIQIAPWNLFSNSTGSAAGDNRNCWGAYAVYNPSYETTAPGTPIPTSGFTDLFSTQAGNTQLDSVHVNSVHVEFIPVFTVANNSFVATVACFDNYIPSDNSSSISANVWYKTSTMLLQHGSRQVSSNGIGSLCANYFSESIDQPSGDGWNLMINNLVNTGASIGFSDSPRLCFKIEGASQAMSVNVVVTACYSAFPTVAGLNNISVQTPELGPRSSDFFDLLFGTYPDLKYASAGVLSDLNSAIMNSGTTDADSLFKVCLKHLGKDFSHKSRSLTSGLPYENSQHDNLEIIQ